MAALSDASAALAPAGYAMALSLLADMSAQASIQNRLSMYIIDAAHYLYDKGAIAPQKGHARRFAEFVGAVVAAATHPGRVMVASGCFKCRKASVQPDVARDGAVI